MPKPADCTSMAQIRAEIDRLDEELVRLFAERAGYIDRRHADTYGLPPELVEKLWRRLIDWSIAREESKLGPDSLRKG
jgi:isochorismate pyruvate lyase